MLSDIYLLEIFKMRIDAYTFKSITEYLIIHLS